jgi:hypothetical protein
MEELQSLFGGSAVLSQPPIEQPPTTEWNAQTDQQIHYILMSLSNAEILYFGYMVYLQ